MIIAQSAAVSIGFVLDAIFGDPILNCTQFDL